MRMSYLSQKAGAQVRFECCTESDISKVFEMLSQFSDSTSTIDNAAVVEIGPDTSFEARALVQEFLKQAKIGTIHPVLQRYVVALFEAALMHGPDSPGIAARLLGLKEMAANRPRRLTDRNKKILLRIVSLVGDGRTSLDEAFQTIATEFRITFENTKKIYYRNRPSPQSEDGIPF